MKTKLINFVATCYLMGLASTVLIAREVNFLEEILDKKINFFETDLLPYLDNFSAHEKVEVTNRYRYLTDLKNNNQLLVSDFNEELYGSDVWHLNEAFCYALGLKESGLSNWCESVDLNTVCPPIFWDYSTLFEIEPDAAKNLLSNYFLCVSQKDEYSELVLTVCAQMILFLNGEDFEPMDAFRLVDWALDAADRIDRLNESHKMEAGKHMKDQFVLFIKNMWTQKRIAFFPFLYCLNEGRNDFEDLDVIAVFDESFLQSVCSIQGGEKFLRFVSEENLFSDEMDKIRQGDFGLFLRN